MLFRSSVTFRLCMVVGLGTIGSVFLLFPGVRADMREAGPAQSPGSPHGPGSSDSPARIETETP